jgi:hypothetical protein
MLRLAGSMTLKSATILQNGISQFLEVFDWTADTLSRGRAAPS